MNDWPGEFQTLLAGWLGGGARLTVPSLGRCLHLFTLLSSKNKVMKPAEADTVNKAGSLWTLAEPSLSTLLLVNSIEIVNWNVNIARVISPG